MKDWIFGENKKMGFLGKNKDKIFGMKDGIFGGKMRFFREIVDVKKTQMKFRGSEMKEKKKNVM